MGHVSRWRSLHHWARREAGWRHGARHASCHRITGISPTTGSIVGRSIRSGSPTLEDTEPTGLCNQTTRCLLRDFEVTREVARWGPRVPMEPIEVGHLLEQRTAVLGSLAVPHGDHAGVRTLRTPLHAAAWGCRHRGPGRGGDGGATERERRSGWILLGTRLRRTDDQRHVLPTGTSSGLAEGPQIYDQFRFRRKRASQPPRQLIGGRGPLLADRSVRPPLRIPNPLPGAVKPRRSCDAGPSGRPELVRRCPDCDFADQGAQSTRAPPLRRPRISAACSDGSAAEAPQVVVRPSSPGHRARMEPE